MHWFARSALLLAQHTHSTMPSRFDPNGWTAAAIARLQEIKAREETQQLPRALFDVANTAFQSGDMATAFLFASQCEQQARDNSQSSVEVLCRRVQRRAFPQLAWVRLATHDGSRVVWIDSTPIHANGGYAPINPTGRHTIRDTGEGGWVYRTVVLRPGTRYDLTSSEL